MHLRKQKKSDGRIYLSIVQSYRTPEGKTRSRTIRSLGYVDKLAQEYDDPIIHFQTVVDELNRKRKDISEPTTVTFPPDAKIPMGSSRQLEAGSIIAAEYFHHRLRLGRFFNKAHMEHRCSPQTCNVVEMLTWNRIAHPQTLNAAWETHTGLPGITIASRNEMFQSIKQLASIADEIITWINTALDCSQTNRQDSPYYCFVSNYYVEATRFMQSSPTQNWEEKPNPLIQTAVLVDNIGLPIDYEIFDGVLSDQLTLLPAAHKLCQRHPDIYIVVVANKGVGTNPVELSMWLNKDCGFIFSQSLRKGTRAMRDWALNCQDYRAHTTADFKIKERIAKRDVDRATKTNICKINVKEVAFWHRTSFERSRFERYRIVQRNESIYAHGAPSTDVKNPIRSVRGTGSAKLGDIGDHVWQVYWDKIATDEAMDGYHMIVSSETSMDGSDLVSIYRNLFLIHDFFRMPPSEWSTCPEYIDRSTYIRSHFLICYIAATMVQLIYRDVGCHHQDASILETLACLNGSEIEHDKFYFDYRTPFSDALASTANIDLSHPIATQADIAEMVRKTRT